jgi:hypothetical protein
MEIPLGSAVFTGSFGDPHPRPAPVTAFLIGRIAHRHGSLGDPPANSVRAAVNIAAIAAESAIENIAENAVTGSYEPGI